MYCLCNHFHVSNPNALAILYIVMVMPIKLLLNFELECVYVCERERERECVCVSECLCVCVCCGGLRCLSILKLSAFIISDASGSAAHQIRVYMLTLCSDGSHSFWLLRSSQCWEAFWVCGDVFLLFHLGSR